MFPAFRGEHINFLARLTPGQPAVCPRAVWTLTRAKSLCLCAFFLPKIRRIFGEFPRIFCRISVNFLQKPLRKRPHKWTADLKTRTSSRNLSSFCCPSSCCLLKLLRRCFGDTFPGSPVFTPTQWRYGLSTELVLRPYPKNLFRLCFFNSVQTRCIVKGEAQKSPLFWRFSGGLCFSQDRLFSRNSTRKP